MAQQQTLPLEEQPQLTGWLKGTPATNGWYNTRPVAEIQSEEPARVRRFWDGTKWSRPAPIGDGNELAAKRARMGASCFMPGFLCYQGLTAPHPDWKPEGEAPAPQRRRLGA